METEFNLQTFLSDMRTEQRADHKELSDKIDKVVGDLVDHDRRLIVVEATRATVRWVAGAAIVAGLGVLGDIVVNHLKP